MKTKQEFQKTVDSLVIGICSGSIAGIILLGANEIGNEYKQKLLLIILLTTAAVTLVVIIFNLQKRSTN